MLFDTPLTPHDSRDANYFYDPPTPVPIFQDQWELEQLLKLYVARRPMRVLEVGTYHGGTLYHWLQNAQPGAVVVSVDIYNAGVDNRHLYPDWTPEGVTLHVIAGNSRDRAIVNMVRELGPYDFIFIDADHYAEPVRQDWQNYGSMAASGGLVAFHDIITHHSWPSIEVEKIWRQIQRQGYVTQEFTWSTGVPPNDQGWGGIGCVFMP